MWRRKPRRAPELAAGGGDPGAASGPPPSRAAGGAPSGSGRAPLDAGAMRGGWGKVRGVDGAQSGARARGRRRKTARPSTRGLGAARDAPPPPPILHRFH